jgi:hypothetical protein
MIKEAQGGGEKLVLTREGSAKGMGLSVKETQEGKSKEESSSAT